MPLSWNLGTLTSCNPLGHSRPVTGLLYLTCRHITNSQPIRPRVLCPNPFHSSPRGNEGFPGHQTMKNPSDSRDSLEAGWAPGPVWMGGKSRPHRDSIPDCPTRSQSLYRLSYRPTISCFFLQEYITMHGHRKLKHFSYIYPGMLKKTTATVSPMAPCVLFVVRWLTDSTLQHLYVDDFKVNEISATPSNRWCRLHLPLCISGEPWLLNLYTGPVPKDWGTTSLYCGTKFGIWSTF